jgi:hypothetical protein
MFEETFRIGFEGNRLGVSLTSLIVHATQNLNANYVDAGSEMMPTVSAASELFA